MWLQTGLLDLKHQTIEILLMVLFYAVLKELHFSKFFEILKFISSSCLSCFFILSEHCMPNTVELAKSILTFKTVRILHTSCFNVID